MGFDQVRNIREYKFDGVAENGTTLHFVVNADLALFVMYHVGLQEGPALCLKKGCVANTVFELLRLSATSLEGP